MAPPYTDRLDRRNLSSPERAYVFGYGSLTAAHNGRLRPAQLVHIDGFRRTWNVAMDNRVTLPGYKYYLDPETGERPAVFVTFLNLIEDLDCAVNGIVIPVRATDLDLLDDRERNYARFDVTDLILEPINGPVWAYFGTEEARRRYEEGVRQGTAVVDTTYYESVRDELRRLGEEPFAEFEKTTDEPACPQRRLERVDL